MSPMFVPGPVDVDPEVLNAQAKPMLPHRSKEFEGIFQGVEEKAKRLFYTTSPVLIVTASGTGLQEAGIRSLVQEKVLCCVNGAFASRWLEVAQTNGKTADKLEAAWDQPITPEMVVQSLEGKRYEAIAIVHNETSTGLENPVREIAAVVREVSPDTLIMVDAVSSLGGVRLEMDAWGIDYLLTSSQKCLALPPGLSLCGVSARALQRAEAVPNRGWYFDLLRLEKHRTKDSTPATPAMSLIFALDRQLDRIFAEGLDARFERHQRMAERVQQWAEQRGQALYAPLGYRSKTVTTVQNQSGLDISDMNRFLLQREMRLANGYGALKGKTFRIAHMGETSLADIETLLQALDEYLQR